MAKLSSVGIALFNCCGETALSRCHVLNSRLLLIYYAVKKTKQIVDVISPFEEVIRGS